MIDKNLLLEMQKHKKLFIVLMVFVLVNGVLLATQANLIMVIINSVFIEGLAIGSLKKYFYCLLLALVLRSVVIFVHEFLAHKIARKIQYHLQEKLLKQIIYLGPTYLASQQSGQLLNLVTEGIGNLENYFSKYLPHLAVTLMIPLIILIVIFKLDFISGMLLLITVPLMPLFMILIGKMSGKASSKQWQVLRFLSGHFLDMIQGLATLKLFGRSKEQSEIVEKISNEFKDVTLGVLKIAFLSALVLELIATMGIALVAVSLGLRLLDGGISFADAFLILLLMPEFYLPFRQLGASFHAGMNAMAASDSIYKTLLLQNDEIKGSEKAELSAFNEIVFKDVNYIYSDNREALNNCNFVIKAGEKVALVGSSGSGKSTILNLLLGLIKPTKGEIFIDSNSLNDFSLQSWSNNIICIGQAPHVFARSIMDNIKIAKKNADTNEVKAAAILAKANSFIEKLPDGYDTIVGEGGLSLSGGQIRRIALARAFLSEARIILLDEPMEGLDIENELAISEALLELSKERTIIVVAHKLTTTINFDKVVLLNQGRVVECDTPAELLKNNGEYARLVKAYRGIM